MAKGGSIYSQNSVTVDKFIDIVEDLENNSDGPIKDYSLNGATEDKSNDIAKYLESNLTSLLKILRIIQMYRLTMNIQNN